MFNEEQERIQGEKGPINNDGLPALQFIKLDEPKLMVFSDVVYKQSSQDFIHKCEESKPIATLESKQMQSLPPSSPPLI